MLTLPEPEEFFYQLLSIENFTIFKEKHPRFISTGFIQSGFVDLFVTQQSRQKTAILNNKP